MSVKISELPSLETLADNDILAGVDTSEDTTSKITLEKIKDYTTEDVYDKEEVDNTIDALQTQIDSLSTIYNAFPTVSDEDESMTLDDTAEVTFKKLNLKGNTSQVSYSGKNLIDLATYSSKDSNVTLSFIDNNLLVSMSSGSYGKVIYDVTNLFKANQGKKINIRYDSINLTSYTGASSNTLIQIKRNSTNTTLLNAELTKTIYTIPSDITDSDVFQIAIFGSGSSSNASSVTYNKLMFYFGEESASFEPYVGGTASPNPSYPQPVNVASGDNTIDVEGKNLFNKDDYSYVNAGFNTGTLNTLTSNANAYTIYIPCKPNQTYTLTKTKGARFFVGYTKTTPALNVEVFGRVGANDSTQWTITTDSDAQYLVALVYNSSVDTSLTLQQVLDTVMIENNSSATTYEPYIGNSYPISLGDIELCKIGTYQDYIYKDNGVWYLHKEIGKVVLNGSEGSWTTQTQTGFYRYGLTINDMNNVSSLANEILIKSTGFRGISFNNRGSDTSETIYAVSNGEQHGFFVNTQFTTITNFKNYLGTNNTPCYYVLATPTNTPITDTTLIKQLDELELATSYEEQTNITQENNDKPFILDVEAIKKLT